ncbi:MAG: GntR family transcriptional regulator [Kosmotoga sp.]|jgi:GntR family transcriptional regulator|nr:MAG: GntR family transcriptional regulator [Kosmotoga sp.]
MWFNINMRSPVPIYKQIKRNIYKLLLRGEIKDGEMLPSIRDLASSIRVNPNTVARSYREMESEGIVVARQGLGYMIITNRNQIRKIILEELKKDLSDYLIRYQKLGVTLDEVLEVIKTLWKENKV